ncbi:MAG: hypothetical protein JXN61_05310 [Sedimentisphaerales bacterium]|nr:hypothetical protein [Sedimentisphaerales bacterium]
MRSPVSAVEYFVLAVLQAFAVCLLLFAWVVWQIAWRSSWCVFEALLACLFWLCRGGTCRTTVKLLRRLPPDFGVTEWSERDAD